MLSRFMTKGLQRVAGPGILKTRVQTMWGREYGQERKETEERGREQQGQQGKEENLKTLEDEEDTTRHRRTREKQLSDHLGPRKKWYPSMKEVPSPTHSLQSFRRSFEKELSSPSSSLPDLDLVLVGRVRSRRDQGKNLIFLDLISGSEMRPSSLQIVLQAKHYSSSTSSSSSSSTSSSSSSSQTFGEDGEWTMSWEQIVGVVAKGDVVMVRGYPRRTPRGELSLEGRELVMLTPCLQDIPLVSHLSSSTRLSDPDIRYRQRHLDLLIDMLSSPPAHSLPSCPSLPSDLPSPSSSSSSSFASPDPLSPSFSPSAEDLPQISTGVQKREWNVRDVFFCRSRIIEVMRRAMRREGFIEVETPTLALQAGGANAYPFTTHMRSLSTAPSQTGAVGQQLYLRIAPELYLKQLVIGGVDRVFEIGKQFRNEGLDSTHNPEFSTCELYRAFATRDDLLLFTESLLSEMAMELYGSYEFETKEGTRLSFKRPFRRISIMEELERQIGSSLPDPNDPSSLPLWFDLLHEHLGPTKTASVRKGGETIGRAIDALVGEYLEPMCHDPTFLMDHPLSLSPLAKEHYKKKGMAERFELFIQGKEVCNAYSELNDPEEQRARFERQVADRASGDEEAQIMDEAFVDALSYALPPTAGAGFGIDRLAMLFTGASHIRDVLFFPMMKPKV